MKTRERPIGVWLASGLILAALLITSGRTLYDVYDLSKTRDAVAMSGIWAQAVWCNVAIWIALGIPLFGALAGWNIGRVAVAFWSAILVAALFYLMRAGAHQLNGWAIGIVALQVAGAILFFVPPTDRYFRPQEA